jgi:hypothetical protein
MTPEGDNVLHGQTDTLGVNLMVVILVYPTLTVMSQKAVEE